MGRGVHVLTRAFIPAPGSSRGRVTNECMKSLSGATRPDSHSHPLKQGRECEASTSDALRTYRWHVPFVADDQDSYTQATLAGEITLFLNFYCPFHILELYLMPLAVSQQRAELTKDRKRQEQDHPRLSERYSDKPHSKSTLRMAQGPLRPSGAPTLIKGREFASQSG